MIRRSLTVIALGAVSLIWPSVRVAWSQEPKAIIISRHLGISAVDTLRMTRDNSGAGVDNSTKLNAAMRNSAYKLPIAFPGGRYYLGVPTDTSITGTCLQIPNTAGYTFVGAGFTTGGGGGTAPKLATEFIYAGPRVSLASCSLSVSGGSPTVITIASGYTVSSQDVGATVEILGGSGNQTNGTYVITAASPGAGTWTLDRACATGDVTSLQGLMTYSLVRNAGWGTEFDMIAFKGSGSGNYHDSSRAHVGVHVVTSTTPSGNATGKTYYRRCAFQGFDSAVMCGLDYRNVGASTFTGETNTHADHQHFEFPWINNCLYGLHTRTGQSVTHTMLHPRILGIGVTVASTLTTRASDTAGTLTASSSTHYVATGSTVDVRWSGGTRTNVTVGSVSGTSIPFSGGAGDVLPAESTAITVTRRRGAFYYCERGGNSIIIAASVSGSTFDLIRLGSPASNHGGVSVIRTVLDAGTFNFRMLSQDFQRTGGRHTYVLFDGVDVANGTTFTLPCFGALGAVQLEVRGMTSLAAGSIRAIRATSGSQLYPKVALLGCGTVGITEIDGSELDEVFTSDSENVVFTAYGNTNSTGSAVWLPRDELIP